jgi:hypothetical protein
MTTLMADSVEPLAEIPHSFRSQRNRGALLYADGRYEASTEVTDAFPRREWISVTGRPGAAAKARFQDSERYDATPGHWPAFRAEREQLCHDGKVTGWPGVYCSISPGPGYGVAAIMQACRDARQEPPRHWLIAWYTSNGYAPSAVQVAAEIRRQTGITLDPATIYGCQFATGAWDTSVVYQDPGWA